MENMPSEHQVQKVIYVETIDAVVTGSGRFVLQDLLDGDLQADIQFEKAQVAGSAKKYNENIIKLQNLPISIVSGDVIRIKGRLRGGTLELISKREQSLIFR